MAGPTPNSRRRLASGGARRQGGAEKDRRRLRAHYHCQGVYETSSLRLVTEKKRPQGIKKKYQLLHEFIYVEVLLAHLFGIIYGIMITHSFWKRTLTNWAIIRNNSMWHPSEHPKRSDIIQCSRVHIHGYSLVVKHGLLKDTALI